MTGRFKLWLAISLLVVFLAGLATGLFAGARHARHVFHGRHGGFGSERMREHLRRELRLTPEQYRQIEPVLIDLGDRLETIRRETRRRVGETMSGAHEKIVPVLTPEQRERLERMRRRHHRIMRIRGEMPPPDHPRHEQ